MCAPKGYYNFLAYAKSCSCNLACKYVCKVNNGYDGEELLSKLQLLDSYIESIENYIYSCCKNMYYKGIKTLGGKKIVMSKNNSLYLESGNQKVKIQSSDLNCLTEEQVCELVSRIKRICVNC